MSVTISTCDQISKSPLNCSKSKMLYTFSKQNRFKKSDKIICDQFYIPNFIQTSRSTTFGYGSKYDFSKTTRFSPPCNAYTLKSDFQPSKIQKKGFGFGKGRQQMQITGPLVSSIKNNNPGPGSYQLPRSNNKTSFSFSSRLQQNINKQKSKIPGPGFYPVALSINKQGRYPVSKIKNILVRNFSTTIGRKHHIQFKAPDPGSYNITKSSLSPDGKYPLSKMQNCTARKFGTGMRSSLNDKKITPGPGNYKLPSQFGHYVSKKFKDCIEKSDNKENVNHEKKQ